jgi:hypothetical protein
VVGAWDWYSLPDASGEEVGQGHWQVNQAGEGRGQVGLEGRAAGAGGREERGERVVVQVQVEGGGGRGGGAGALQQEVAGGVQTPATQSGSWRSGAAPFSLRESFGSERLERCEMREKIEHRTCKSDPTQKKESVSVYP